MALQKGVAQTIGIICYDGETPTAPVDLAAEVSTDGGGFSAADNAPVSIADGLVTLLLSATEMDGDVVAVKLTSSNLEDQMAVYLTEADWTATEAGYIDAAVTSRAPAGEYDTELDATISSRAPAGEYDTELDATISSRAPANEYDSELDVAVSTRAPAGEYDTEMARLDTTISSRSALTEAQVQAIVDGLENLSEAEVQDIIDALQAHGDSAWITATGFATPGDEMALTAAERAFIIGAVTGGGSLPVTVPVEDDQGAPVASLVFIVRSSAGAIIASWRTDISGGMNLLLDPGDYEIWLGPSPLYAPANPYAITVVAAGVLSPLVVNRVAAPPAPTDPAVCNCYLDLRYVAGEKATQLIGAEEGWVDITALETPTLFWPAAGTAAGVIDGARIFSDAQGRIVFGAVRTSRLRLAVTRPWSGPTGRRTDQIEITVPDAETYQIEPD